MSLCNHVLCSFWSKSWGGTRWSSRGKRLTLQLSGYTVHKPILGFLSCPLLPQDSLHRQAVDRSQQMEREVSEARREVEELRQERVEWQQQQVHP